MSLGAKGEDWRIRLGMRLKLGGCGWIRGGERGCFGECAVADGFGRVRKSGCLCF